MTEVLRLRIFVWYVRFWVCVWEYSHKNLFYFYFVYLFTFLLTFSLILRWLSVCHFLVKIWVFYWNFSDSNITVCSILVRFKIVNSEFHSKLFIWQLKSEIPSLKLNHWERFFPVSFFYNYLKLFILWTSSFYSH